MRNVLVFSPLFVREIVYFEYSELPVAKECESEKCISKMLSSNGNVFFVIRLMDGPQEKICCLRFHETKNVGAGWRILISKIPYFWSITLFDTEMVFEDVVYSNFLSFTKCDALHEKRP